MWEELSFCLTRSVVRCSADPKSSVRCKPTEKFKLAVLIISSSTTKVWNDTLKVELFSISPITKSLTHKQISFIKA